MGVYLVIFIELIFLFLHLLFFMLIIFMILALVKGAPYVPTNKKRREIMIKLAGIKKGMKTVDLGSGDGRLVISMAEGGAEAHGFEINLFLVLFSRLLIWKNHLKGKAFIHWNTFWRVDLSSFNVVTVYGINRIMKDLGKKLKKELKPGSRVISNVFTFPDWKEQKTVDDVHLYTT